MDGAAPVYDPRVETLAALCKPQRTKFAETTMVLCPDVPAEGKGAWMDAARKSELLCVVLRAFTASDVFHPRGSVDAARDRSDLATEILFSDVDMVDKRLERIAKEKRAGQTVAQQLARHYRHIRRRGQMLRGRVIKPRAVLKSMIPNALDTFGYRHMGQISASLKDTSTPICPIKNFDAPGDGNVGQVGAVSECL